MIRKQSWLHLGFEGIHPFGGLTFLLREPKTEKAKSEPGRKLNPS